MKKLMPYFFGVILGAFVLAVAGAVLYYSWTALDEIFPGDFLGKIFGLINFDIAAFVWFGALVYLSRSTFQYVWAGVGFLLGLAGAAAMISISVGLSAGAMERSAIIQPLTYIFIAVVFGHLVLIYLRHMSAPEVSADISLGVERAKIIDKAQAEAEKMLTKNLDALAAPIAARLVGEVMRDLNIAPGTADVLDLPALPVLEEEPKQQPNFLLQRLFSWANGARKFESSAQNVKASSAAAAPMPSPARTDAGSDASDANGVK